jgi:hypothetical protein
MQLGGAAAATESEVSVGGGAFAAPWSPCTMHTPCACATFPKRVSLPFLAGVQSSRRSWLCQRSELAAWIALIINLI